MLSIEEKVSIFSKVVDEAATIVAANMFRILFGNEELNRHIIGRKEYEVCVDEQGASTFEIVKCPSLEKLLIDLIHNTSSIDQVETDREKMLAKSVTVRIYFQLTDFARKIYDIYCNIVDSTSRMVIVS